MSIPIRRTPRLWGMGLLRVTVDDKVDITADLARVHVWVEGESFVLGNAALDRAREVREFVLQLQTQGLAATEIQVQGVNIASSSGVLAKHQKVEFSLVVQTPAAQLPQVLGVVAAQRNVRMRRLEWVFADFEASVSLAAQAMRKARRKAEAMAEAAGQRVTGIHLASDAWQMPVATRNLDFMQEETPRAAPRSRHAEPLDVGAEYSATQALRVHLTVDFTLE